MRRQPSGRTLWLSGSCYVPGVLLVFSAVVFLPRCTGAFDNAESRMTLRGVSALEIGVSEIIPAVARAGVTSTAIHKEVTRQLQRAGIVVVNRAALLERADSAFLAVTVGAIRHPAGRLYAYSIDVGVYQPVMLRRDPALVLSLPTWSTGSFGLVGSTNLRSLLSSISQRVDDLLQAHRAVNPRTEARSPARVRAAAPRKRVQGAGGKAAPTQIPKRQPTQAVRQ